MASRKRSISNDADMSLYKEWDEASCPICMDHPHNAVLLLCSSHDKGCRSYICDTSYRHSNCLDRFKKLNAENSDNQSSATSNPQIQYEGITVSNGYLAIRNSSNRLGIRESQNLMTTEMSLSQSLAGGSGGQVHAADNSQEVVPEITDPTELPGRRHEEFNQGNMLESKLNLRCPLCRGEVLGWKVMEEARKYLNLKVRSCSHESCSFLGSYRELRRHARRVHPTVRPADIDPSRQRAWRRLEDQRERDDIVSAIRSAMPGAIVLGDYVIENGDRLSGERERGGRWLSTFFLFHMIGNMDPVTELRGGRSRMLSRHRRSTGPFPRRRFLWGENLLGLQDEDDDDEDEDDDEADMNMLSDIGEDVSSNPRRRRRLVRPRRSDEDRS